MKRTILLFTAMGVLLASGAAAQAQLDVGPGMVGADSPLYGLETAMDNAAVSVGLAKAGGVAQERAAEARDAQEKNNTKAMQKAVDQMNAVAKKAKSSDTQGLEKASAVLNEVMAQAPAEAQEGLQTALDNISAAKERAAAQGPDQAPTDGEAGAPNDSGTTSGSGDNDQAPTDGTENRP